MRVTQDIRVALRRLAQSPGFTTVALLTLALGIGANTAIFTAINGLILRPLPVQRPGRLVFLNRNLDNLTTNSYPDYVDFRDRNNVLSGLIGYRVVPLSLSRGGGENSRVWGYEATGNYFDVLGVQPMLGRAMTQADDVKPGAHPVTVLSYAGWKRYMGGDPGVVGKVVKINGIDFTILGVMPPGFRGTEVIFSPDLWLPMMMQAQVEGGHSWLNERATEDIMLVGRLKDGVSSAQAEQALNVIAGQLAHDYPAADEGMHITLSPPGLVGNWLRGITVAFASVLMGVAGFVLLIACTNLASLLLARASDRRREIAIRLAVGAARRQLVAQLLTESLVLSLAGGVLGLLTAMWTTDLFASWRPPIDFELFTTFSIDLRVTLFALAASVVTSLLFGLAPALHSTKSDIVPALKNELRSERFGTWHLRDFLVCTQVVLSVVLLIGAVLVIQSLRQALHVNVGFNPQNAVMVSFDLSLQGYDPQRGKALQSRLMERLESLPGVEAASAANALPLGLDQSYSSIYAAGKPTPKVNDVPSATTFETAPGYFRTMQIRMLAGRDFDRSDSAQSRRVVIVNDTLTGKLFPGEDPLGKQIQFGVGGAPMTIVGVVKTGKYASLNESPRLAVFSPFTQAYNGTTVVVARSKLPPDQVIALLRRTVLGLDSNISFYGTRPLVDHLGFAFYPARIAASALGVFGFIALALAATGVYGVMAYAVARRSREIGIRMAIGATPAQVLRVVFARTGTIIAAGCAIGSALALLLARFLGPVIYGVDPRDPVTYSVAVIAIAVVAALSCWLPARKALSVAPVNALRSE